MFTSCFTEEFVSDSDVQLTFSVDTLRFDTVFASLGSATLGFTVKNPSDENVVVSSISLVDAPNSMFRINVDGIADDFVSDIKVLANDSIYVFVEVTVDPDLPLSISPFVIHEQVGIKMGNRTQNVTLEAFGQNANYFPSRDAKGRLIGLSCENQNVIWDDPKPYVVFGLLFIDSCSLVIAPGTQVYVHGGIALLDDNVFQDGGLIFLEQANLDCRGTIAAPITFQGARLETSFQDDPGQWAGLRFFNKSINNVIEHTTIKNSVVGIRLDSASSVDLNAVTIANTSNVGIIGIHASLKADNLLVHSNGPQSCAFVYGGNYQFRYTTLANYENQSPALYMDNFTCKTADCNVLDINALHISFENSIIMGSNDDEIEMIDATEGSDPSLFSVDFDHTIIRIDETKLSLPSEACNMCIEWQNEPMFIDQDNDIYLLDTMSLAIDQGIPIEGLEIDLLGNIRSSMNPDLGCFEFEN